MDAIVRRHALFLREGSEYYVSIKGFDKLEALNFIVFLTDLKVLILAGDFKSSEQTAVGRG